MWKSLGDEHTTLDSGPDRPHALARPCRRGVIVVFIYAGLALRQRTHQRGDAQPGTRRLGHKWDALRRQQRQASIDIRAGGDHHFCEGKDPLGGKLICSVVVRPSGQGPVSFKKNCGQVAKSTYFIEADKVVGDYTDGFRATATGALTTKT